ncbi:hypothetical protein Patl1_02050 [Pistacia atlantica]|uniref:Uncharacterized protein n=1 Tax=Pistacia atlantica TaxID=434234 RepID=A0ACC1C931_9ROSI|nr:hypothetical protein Patl1_02050 [Pistacia atlantica]
MESTMIIAITRSKIMAIIMHFLDFFCKLFATRRASVPMLTWSTAFVTCNKGIVIAYVRSCGVAFRKAFNSTWRNIHKAFQLEAIIQVWHTLTQRITNATMKCF